MLAPFKCSSSVSSVLERKVTEETLGRKMEGNVDRDVLALPEEEAEEKGHNGPSCLRRTSQSGADDSQPRDVGVELLPGTT